VLLTEYEASIEAVAYWGYVRRVMAEYFAAGGTVSDFARSNWRASLGVRVQGGLFHGLILAEIARDLDAALTQHLRVCNVQAYVLAMKDIEEPNRPYHNSRGTGSADLLCLTREEARDLFARAKECVYTQMARRRPNRSRGACTSVLTFIRRSRQGHSLLIP